MKPSHAEDTNDVPPQHIPCRLQTPLIAFQPSSSPPCLHASPWRCDSEACTGRYWKPATSPSLERTCVMSVRFIDAASLFRRCCLIFTRSNSWYRFLRARIYAHREIQVQGTPRLFSPSPPASGKRPSKVGLLQAGACESSRIGSRVGT